MYALVFWVKTKMRSVVKISDLLPEKEEGEVTSVKYTDGRLYEAKIVRKSGKFNQNIFS